MVLTFEVKTNISRLIGKVNDLNVEVPEEIGKAGFEFMKLAQRNLRLQLTKNKNRWNKSHVWNTIKAEKLSKKRSVLKISQEGIWLDSAKPHWAPLRFRNGRLRSGSSLVRWAQTAPNSPFKGKKLPPYMWVKNHPFINDGINRSINNFPRILKKRLARALQ